MRGDFGWDLPPGVSQRMIDEFFGGDPPCEPCEDDQHGDCEGGDCGCGECIEAAAEDAADAAAEERRLNAKYDS